MISQDTLVRERSPSAVEQPDNYTSTAGSCPPYPRAPPPSELTFVFPGARVSLANVPRKPSLTFFLAPHRTPETVHGTEAVEAKPAWSPC